MWRARFCFVLRGAILEPFLDIFGDEVSMPQRRTFFILFSGCLECLLQILACDLFLNGGFPIKFSWDEHLILHSEFASVNRMRDGIWMDARSADRIIPHQQRSPL